MDAMDMEWLAKLVTLWGGLLLAGIAIISYFLGCFNGAVIVSKYILRDDVRNHGSGNAGLTNFYRTFGGPLTFVVILDGCAEGGGGHFAGSAWAFRQTFGDHGRWPVASTGQRLFCLLGHMFPCMFHFKGGKGILSGGTIAIMMDWRIALVVWGGFLILCHPDPVRVSGVCLGWGQLPLYLLVLLSVSFPSWSWPSSSVAWWFGSTGHKHPRQTLDITVNEKQVQLPS